MSYPLRSATTGEYVNRQWYPTKCAAVDCGKALPPPCYRPFWLRGSDFCMRHATYQKRVATSSPAAKAYLEQWTEREKSAKAATLEPEFIYVKDSGNGSIRKIRANLVMFENPDKD